MELMMGQRWSPVGGGGGGGEECGWEELREKPLC